MPKVLLVYPPIPSTYWSYKHVLPMIGKRAVMPPLGLLTVAAMLPEGYPCRLVDMNVDILRPEDVDWADLVFVSAMIVQKRAFDWAHAHGIKAHLHSCGNITRFVPDLVDAGLDCLNPLEVKAGMDGVALKRTYGDRLALHGGVNAVLWDKPAEIEAEMRRVLPALKQNGGYIFSSDHSVPSSVSLEDFRRIIALAKELGSYA